MNVYSYTLLGAALINFSLCFVIWYKRPIQRVYRFANVLILAFGLWALGDFFKSLAISYDEALFWARATFIVRSMTGMLFLFFMLELAKVLGVWKRRIPFVALAILPGAIAVMGAFTPMMVPGVVELPWGWGNQNNYFHLIFMGYSLLYMSCSFILGLFCVRKMAKKKLTFFWAALFGGTLLIFYLYSLYIEFYYPLNGIFERPSLSPYLYVIISCLAYIFFSRFGFVEISPEVAADKLAETMPDAMVVFEKKGKILLANKEFSRLLAYNLPELKKKNIFSIFSLSQSEFSKQLYPKLENDRNIVDFDIFCLGKDKKRHHLAFSFSPLKDNLGRLIGIVGVGKDMAERDELVEELTEYRQSLEISVKEKTEQLEEKVRQLEDTRKAVLNVLEDVRVEKDRAETEKYRVETLLESIGDGVFAVDNNNKIVVFNKEAEQLTGLKTEKVIGKDYHSVIRFYTEGRNKKINLGFIEEAIKEKESAKIEGKNVLLNAEDVEIDVDSIAAPILSQEGVMSGVVVVFRDVSEERTVERMKTEFVSVASHQLRTPLSGVKWFLEMLLSGDAGKLKDQQQEFVQEAFDSNDRMINLVNDLLNVSRLETGKIVPEIQKVDVAKLITTIISEREVLMQAKNAVVDFKKGKGKFVIDSDPSLLKQIVGNLVDNAIKYADKGGGEVAVKLAKDGNSHIKITVTDNGIGIPMDKQYMIFSKFFRAENATRAETEGSGLGLYICRLIVESFNGRVWFKSPLHPHGKKKGTSFIVVLPTKASSK